VEYIICDGLIDDVVYGTKVLKKQRVERIGEH
jgi:hypothetical protein